MLVDLYIYYQVRAENARSLESRVRAMQDRLAETHGIVGQLKRRPEPKDGLQTWMEIYPATGPGFPDVLDAAVRDAGFAQLSEGDRHTEIFMDFLTCA